MEIKKTVFTYSASNKIKWHSSDSGLTAGRLGLARFFSSCFLETFSGRWRGDPSDLEEAFGGTKGSSISKGKQRETVGSSISNCLHQNGRNPTAA